MAVQRRGILALLAWVPFAFRAEEAAPRLLAVQDARLLDQRTPARDLGIDELLELLRRRRNLRDRAFGQQQLLHFGVAHHRVDLGGELVDDVLRHARGRRDRVP